MVCNYVVEFLLFINAHVAGATSHKQSGHLKRVSDITREVEPSKNPFEFSLGLAPNKAPYSQTTGSLTG